MVAFVIFRGQALNHRVLAGAVHRSGRHWVFSLVKAPLPREIQPLASSQDPCHAISPNNRGPHPKCSPLTATTPGPERRTISISHFLEGSFCPLAGVSPRRPSGPPAPSPDPWPWPSFALSLSHNPSRPHFPACGPPSLRYLLLSFSLLRPALLQLSNREFLLSTTLFLELANYSILNHPVVRPFK